MEMMWRSYIRFRFLGKKKQDAADLGREKEKLHQAQRRFCSQAEGVKEACALWNPAYSAQLAGRYMAHVLAHQKQLEWWAAQEEFLAQPWFIRRYCLAHGLIQEAEEAPLPFSLRPIRPEKGNGRWIMLDVLRDIEHPDQGNVMVACAYHKELSPLLHDMGFSRKEKGYTFSVDECNAPILDRAAECARRLLQAGYGIAVKETALEQKICHENIAPAHQYWIKEGPSPEYLRLIYPYNPRLHRYLCILGARWENKQMLLPIVHWDHITDVVRLYHFKITKEAQRRIHLWRDIRQEAVIYRPNHVRECSEEISLDRFREMLRKPVQVLPDLEDRDD